MRSPRHLARSFLWRSLARLAPAEIQRALATLTAPGTPAFAPRRAVLDRAPEARSVLVLAPHPDDEAIGAGGTLLAHARAGAALTVVYLTDGAGLGEERAARVERRRAEARAAGALLGCEQLFWDEPDTRLAAGVARAGAALARLLRERRFERVYAPSFFDGHRDHLAANDVLLAGARAAGWDGLVCGYEVWDPVPFPNYVVDVSRFGAERDRLLACYATPHETTDFTALCRRRSALHYTLLVDSRRAPQEGLAEAFLRFDLATYAALRAAWGAARPEARAPSS